MKKTVAAITAGLLLVAGQAVAQNESASARVGDRVGAQASESSEFAGVPLIPLIAVAALIVVGIAVASDKPSSD